MIIFNLRKYFFANVTAFIGYIPIITAIVYNMYPHEPFNPNNFINDDFIIAVSIVLSAEVVVYTFALTLLEILVRKFFIEKKFPDFKFNLKLNIPKYLNIILNVIYTVLFYFGIIISSLMFIVSVSVFIDDVFSL